MCLGQLGCWGGTGASAGLFLPETGFPVGAPVGDVAELASVEVHRLVPEFEDEMMEFITKATKHEHYLKGVEIGFFEMANLVKRRRRLASYLMGDRSPWG